MGDKDRTGEEELLLKLAAQNDSIRLRSDREELLKTVASTEANLLELGNELRVKSKLLEAAGNDQLEQRRTIEKLESELKQASDMHTEHKVAIHTLKSEVTGLEAQLQQSASNALEIDRLRGELRQIPDHGPVLAVDKLTGPVLAVEKAPGDEWLRQQGQDERSRERAQAPAMNMEASGASMLAEAKALTDAARWRELRVTAPSTVIHPDHDVSELAHIDLYTEVGHTSIARAQAGDKVRLGSHSEIGNELDSTSLRAALGLTTPGGSFKPADPEGDVLMARRGLRAGMTVAADLESASLTLPHCCTSLDVPVESAHLSPRPVRASLDVPRAPVLVQLAAGQPVSGQVDAVRLQSSHKTAP